VDEVSRSSEFESAHIAARDMQVGDYLDASAKIRIHAVKQIGANMVAAHKLRGSKAPGVSSFKPDDKVRVWRKKK